MVLSARMKILLVAILFALGWFVNLQYRDLFQTDEGRYAEIPREMLASGNWVTPRLDGIKYFEKPVLQYWATAAAYALFGEHNWSARLWIALTGFLGVFMTAWAAVRLFDRRTAWCAAAILASSIYYVIMGHFNTLDMGVSFFMCASLFAFLLAMRASDRQDIRARRGWMYVAWAAAALGMLSKGLETVVLPGAVFVLYVLLTRDWRRFRELHYYGGIAIFLLLAGPWYLLVSVRNPEFPHYFFIYEHFQRFLTPVSHRPGGWWYFIPILLLALVPWWPQFVRALARLFRRESAAPGFNHTLFLWLWSIFIFVFFSYSDSKLASYILPIVPALAILVGRELALQRRGELLWSALLCMVVALSGLWLAPLVHSDGGHVPLDLYKAFLPWLVAGSGLLLLFAITAFACAYFRRPAAATGLMVVALFAATQIVTSGAQALAPVYSGKFLADQIAPYNQPGVPFYSINGYQQSLPFYLKRTLTLVAYQGELAFGLGLEPQKWIPNIDTFIKRWQRDPRALAVMPTATYARLVKKGVPMQVIGRDPERVAVKKP